MQELRAQWRRIGLDVDSGQLCPGRAFEAVA